MVAISVPAAPVEDEETEGESAEGAAEASEEAAAE